MSENICPSCVQIPDDSPTLKSHWILEVYDGEIIYGRLPLWKHIVNSFCKWRYGLPKYLRPVLNEKPLHVMEGDNLVVTVGKQLILDRIFGLSSVAAVSRIGVGTSGTAAAVGNTSLTGSAFKAFDALPTRTGTTVTAQTTFGTADGNLNWQEVGMDNGSTLLNRVAPIGPFNKTTAVSIIVQVAFTQS